MQRLFNMWINQLISCIFAWLICLTSLVVEKSSCEYIENQATHPERDLSLKASSSNNTTDWITQINATEDRERFFDGASWDEYESVRLLLIVSSLELFHMVSMCGLNLSLIWLIPLIQFSLENRKHFNAFSLLFFEINLRTSSSIHIQHKWISTDFAAVYSWFLILTYLFVVFFCFLDGFVMCLSWL